MNAMNIFEQLASSPSPQELDALYAVGHALFERGDFRKAADVFRFVALADPLRGSAWWALGACHEELDDPEVAATLYDLGFRCGGQPAELGFLCARARARAGDASGARSMLEELSELELSAEVATAKARLETTLEGGAA